jgi:hypothetical protein
MLLDAQESSLALIGAILVTTGSSLAFSLKSRSSSIIAIVLCVIGWILILTAIVGPNICGVLAGIFTVIVASCHVIFNALQSKSFESLIRYPEILPILTTSLLGVMVFSSLCMGLCTSCDYNNSIVLEKALFVLPGTLLFTAGCALMPLKYAGKLPFLQGIVVPDLGGAEITLTVLGGSLLAIGNAITSPLV